MRVTAYDPRWPRRYEEEASRVRSALGERLLAIGRMEELGYEFRGELGVPGRRYFRKGPGYPREFNVHVVDLGGEVWRRSIAFRDRLRTDPETAAAYGRLKRKLIATPGGAEPDRYAAGKDDFIAETLERGG